MNRFQEYAPNYTSGDKKTDLVNLKGISKVPISMMVPKNDRECSLKNAKKTKKLIGDPVVHFKVIKNANHGYFGD